MIIRAYSDFMTDNLAKKHPTIFCELYLTELQDMLDLAAERQYTVEQTLINRQLQQIRNQYAPDYNAAFYQTDG